MSGDVVWHDQDVRFDVSSELLKPIAGEKVFHIFNSVEDVKGNGGERAIGLKCIISIEPRVIQSKIQGMRESLLILASTSERKFEFIFINLIKNDSSLFSCISSVHRAYESTKIYRELKLRGSLINESKLKTLANEEIYREIQGFYNLSNDQKTLKLQDSKFGLALVFEITEQSGGYLLGFRVDPVERLRDVFMETKKLMKAYLHNPIFGLENQSSIAVERQKDKTKEITAAELSDNVDQTEQHSDSFAMYYIDSMKASSRDAEYNEKLGLLMEKLPEGYTLEDLWDVMK